MNDKEPPFKVGDRVRLKAGRPSNMKYTRGTVLKVALTGSPLWPNWGIWLQRDGEKGTYRTWPWKWELVPAVDLGLDDVCRALVAAYQRGDDTAALVLAERIFELLGGTKKEDAT